LALLGRHSIHPLQLYAGLDGVAGLQLSIRLRSTSLPSRRSMSCVAA